MLGISISLWRVNLTRLALRLFEGQPKPGESLFGGDMTGGECIPFNLQPGMAAGWAHRLAGMKARRGAHLPAHAQEGAIYGGEHIGHVTPPRLRP